MLAWGWFFLMDHGGQDMKLRTLTCILAGLMLCLASARASPEEKRRLVLGTATSFATFDPHVIDDPAQNLIRLNFYDGLTRWAGSPPRLPARARA